MQVVYRLVVSWLVVVVPVRVLLPWAGFPSVVALGGVVLGCKVGVTSKYPLQKPARWRSHTGSVKISDANNLLVLSAAGSTFYFYVDYNCIIPVHKEPGIRYMFNFRHMGRTTFL